jgi:nucleoside-diphosphate-sugar epimerase
MTETKPFIPNGDRKVLVLGAGGFIGGHLVKQLVDDGDNVVAVDIKPMSKWHQVTTQSIDLFDAGDPDRLRELGEYHFDEVYNLAADMGGMGFIEGNKLACMLSVLTSTNVLRAARDYGWDKVIYSSSACVYPAYIQNDQTHVDNLDLELSEDQAYPAEPEDGYGWEKLFSERMHRHFKEETSVDTRVVRFHNIYGTHGTWDGGREKAPAALCRKVATAKLSGTRAVEIWGDGSQLRSFCYVDDAVKGIVMVGRGEYGHPVNVGSSELVTINRLLEIITEIAGYVVEKHYVPGALGVKGRSSDNTLIKDLFGWEPSISLQDGLAMTYAWIEEEVAQEMRRNG